MPSDKVAYTQELNLEFAGVLFSLLQDLVVEVDGIRVTTPVFHPSGIAIRNIGGIVVSIVYHDFYVLFLSDSFI